MIRNLLKVSLNLKKFPLASISTRAILSTQNTLNKLYITSQTQNYELLNQKRFYAKNLKSFKKFIDT